MAKIDWSSGIGGAIVGVLGTAALTWSININQDKSDATELKQKADSILTQAQTTVEFAKALEESHKEIGALQAKVNALDESISETQEGALVRANEIDISASEIDSFRTLLDQESEKIVDEILPRAVQSILDKGDFTSISNPASSIKDLTWVLRHSAASASCAATAPVGVSPMSRVVISKHAGRSCNYSCENETNGGETSCSGSFAIGNALNKKATKYGEELARFYNYGCKDSQNGYDEVAELETHYTAYCCCFKSP